MRLRERAIGPGEPPIVIAELGVNHDGRVERALELVDAAAACGADAVKLQWFDAERLVAPGAPATAYQRAAGETSQLDMLRRLELGAQDMRAIVARARERGVLAVVTVFGHDLVDDATPLDWDAFKIASPDIVHRPLLERLARDGRPLLVSTGAATLDEIRTAVAWLGPAPYVLLQCVSAYPVPDEQASLGAIAALADVFPQALGYSDHTTSLDTGALAVAAGARVLEKHFTWCRTAPGPDHAMSLDADGLAAYVRAVRRAWAMLGPREKRVLEIEREVRSAARQSIVARRDLPAGHVLTGDDVAFRRPGDGTPPGDLHLLLGRRALRAIAAGSPLRDRDLA